MKSLARKLLSFLFKSIIILGAIYGVFFIGTIIFSNIRNTKLSVVLEEITLSLPHYPGAQKLNVQTIPPSFPDTNGDYSLSFVSTDKPQLVEAFYDSYLRTNRWAFFKEYREKRPNTAYLNVPKGTVVDIIYRKNIKGKDLIVRYHTFMPGDLEKEINYRISVGEFYKEL